MRRTATRLAIMLAAACTVAGCASSGSTGSDTTASTQPAQNTSAPVHSSSAKSSAASGGGGAAKTKFSVPNEVGKGLQSAQDDVQRVSGNPLFITHSNDATGAGRFQILDRDWKVCGQNVPPGSKANEDTEITFAVVKLEESCP